MTPTEKEEFFANINSLPHWVESFEDLKKFTRHMVMNFLQKKKQLKMVFNYLEMFHPEIHEKCCEIDLEHGHEIKHLYDETYNYSQN